MKEKLKYISRYVHVYASIYFVIKSYCNLNIVLILIPIDI